MPGSSVGSESWANRLVKPNQWGHLGVLWRRIVDLLLTLGVGEKDNAALHRPRSCWTNSGSSFARIAELGAGARGSRFALIPVDLERVGSRPCVGMLCPSCGTQ